MVNASAISADKQEDLDEDPDNPEKIVPTVTKEKGSIEQYPEWDEEEDEDDYE